MCQAKWPRQWQWHCPIAPWVCLVLTRVSHLVGCRGHAEAEAREAVFRGQGCLCKTGALFPLKITRPPPGSGKSHPPATCFDVCSHSFFRSCTQHLHGTEVNRHSQRPSSLPSAALPVPSSAPSPAWSTYIGIAIPILGKQKAFSCSLFTLLHTSRR